MLLPEGLQWRRRSAVLCVPRRGSACSQKRPQRRERRSWRTCTSRLHPQTRRANLALGMPRDPSLMGRNNPMRSRMLVRLWAQNAVTAVLLLTDVARGALLAHVHGQTAEELLHWAGPRLPDTGSRSARMQAGRKQAHGMVTIS